MMTLSPEFQQAISFLSVAFRKRTWKHAQLLLTGAILCPGSRTVCNVLRVLGLENEKAFHKYHRVLSMRKWSARKLADALLEQLISVFVEPGQALVFGIDETIERRWGSRIQKRGIYRDPVRSSASHFVKCSGLRWMSLQLLTQTPWLAGGQCWALPFLTALCPSRRYYEDRPLPRQAKQLTDWARQFITYLGVRAGRLSRPVYLAGDGSYATYELLDHARQMNVGLIVRMRLDARLFDFPPAKRPANMRGAKPKVGKRLLPMEKRLTDGRIAWKTIRLSHWYGRKDKNLLITSGRGIWYKSGQPRVPVVWVLIKDPDGEKQPVLLACTDMDLAAEQIIAFFVRRWRVEVTFAEVRRHLGVETQRQWSDLAIERTTPALMALFSIICLIAKPLFEQNIIRPLSSAWYAKQHISFSDVLTGARLHIWQQNNFYTSYQNQEVDKLGGRKINLLYLLARTAA